MASTNCEQGDQISVAEHANPAAIASSHIIHLVKHGERAKNASADSVLPEEYDPTGQTNLTEIMRTSEVTLLDERTLLACVVRTIPASGRIRISSTVSKSNNILSFCYRVAGFDFEANVVGIIAFDAQLPNRLGKMLAPLHWHDYKKKYGKLDDFVASHPEVSVQSEFVYMEASAFKLYNLFIT